MIAQSATYEAKPLSNIGEIRHRRREDITYRNGIFLEGKKVAEIQSTDKRILNLLTNHNLELLNGKRETTPHKAAAESQL